MAYCKCVSILTNPLRYLELDVGSCCPCQQVNAKSSLSLFPVRQNSATTRHLTIFMNDIKSGRYAENPIKRLVDIYVLDVIGALPPEMADNAQRMDLQRVFKTAA